METHQEILEQPSSAILFGGHAGGARSLAETALASLRAFFNGVNHHPGEEHWAALEDIALTLEAMATGTCEQKVLLSSLDPGTGKTQTVAHFAGALVRDPAFRETGMVVCVGRITEAVALAHDLNLPSGALAILTSDPTANALGAADPDSAQVLITTQQRIEAACQNTLFGRVASFYYRGAPRAVRCWDEAWMPGLAVTLNRDGLLQLVKPLRPVSSALADAVEDFAFSLRGTEDGVLVPVPDFDHGLGVSLADILITAAGITGRFRDDEQMTATALVTMSGRVARAKTDGRNGSTLLTYRDTLPADLAPLLVLDASGRVRETYRYVEEHRGTLIRLREAVKNYSPLTIRTWQTAGSKHGWENNSDELVRGIVAAVLSKPEERWLVVVHKAGARVPDVDRAMRRLLPETVRGNVETLTWGQHQATNLYADVPNVILAGTLFMAPSFYTALTHMAQDRSVEPGLADTAEVAATMRGEHANLVLQALCRGRVRKSDGVKCRPMTAYIIAAKRSGIPSNLPRIFPGCRVMPWRPFEPKVTGKAKAAVDAAKAAFSSGAEAVPYGVLAGAVKMDLKTFKQRVVRLPAWQAAMAALGLEEAAVRGRTKGLRSVARRPPIDVIQGSEGVQISL